MLDNPRVLPYYDGEKLYVKGYSMAEQTGIAKTIDTVDQEAQYDECVKKLLSAKIVLAWIMKECVPEFKQFSIQRIAKDCIEGEPQISMVAVDQDELDYLEELSDEAIGGMNTEDNSIKEGRVFYDIKFSAVVPDSDEPVQLIINVEAQKDDRTAYPLIKRAIYYGSRMISAQKNTVFTKKHYEKIRKVYSIWIQMNVDEEKANTITKYRISEEQVVGTVPEMENNYDLITIVMLRLGAADKADDKSILRLLDVLLSADTKPAEKKAILEKDFDIPMSASMSEEANIMCNLGEGIREKTVIETQMKGVLNLMKTLKLSAEEAISALGISEEDKPSLLKMVDKQLAVK